MKLFIKGGKCLKGEVVIDGAKNAALPIIAASSLIKGTTILKNVPKIKDVYEMLNILEDIGSKIIKKDNTVIISNNELHTRIRTGQGIRASYYFLGALAARYENVESVLPGGCKIGERPIDIHIDAFRDLGYNVSVTNVIKVFGRVSNYEITLKNKSVGATINSILASLNCKREVIIKNVLIEPEVRDVIGFLNASGFQIEKIVSGVKITPRFDIRAIEYEIIPDRIEAMTYVVMGLLTGKLTIKKANVKHIKGMLDYLIDNGAKIKITKDIIVKKSSIRRLDIVCDKYPSIPTDLNSILCVLLLLNEGGTVLDRIFPNRTNSIEELKRLGAIIELDKRINLQPSKIKSGDIKGYDLRGDMALVLAALASKGRYVLELSNIERGYSNILNKLESIKARVKKL